MRRIAAHLHLKQFISITFVFILVFAWTAPVSLQTSASYIVQGASADVAEKLVAQYGGRVTSRLDIIQGVGASLTPEAASALRGEPGITAVTPNATVVLAGGPSRKDVPPADYGDVVGADVVWQQGVIGDGVTVAIVDTGIGRHAGLIRDINGKTKDRLVAWVDFVQNRPNPFDPNGHGTHVAGIIANTEIGADGEWNGIAPGVNLVAVRVLNKDGYGTYEDVIQGIQWVIDHKTEYNIRVLNLSLVALVQSPYWADPLNQASMRAWGEGIVVVAAAGNGGPAPMTIGVPGNNPYVITAGAFTDNYTPNDWSDDYITPFSSAGPTLDAFVKPDVIAPGAHMVSTMMPNALLADMYPDNQVSNHYFWMAGTSQAAATTSGIAALILSNNPNLTPDEVKYRLTYTALPWVDPETGEAGYSMWQQGAGRVNAPDAVFADITGTANNGLDVWADLDGATHYEGFTEYDEETGAFHLRDDEAGTGGYGAWAGGYGAWAGEYSAWAGGYGAWAGGYGAWAGGYGAWAGGYGAWAGGYGAWAGGYGAWAGGYGAWAGGYGAWAGGYGAWAGSEPWAGSIFSDEAFVSSFSAGNSPDAANTTISVNTWVQEP